MMGFSIFSPVSSPFKRGKIGNQPLNMRIVRGILMGNEQDIIKYMNVHDIHRGPSNLVVWFITPFNYI